MRLAERAFSSPCRQSCRHSSARRMPARTPAWQAGRLLYALLLAASLNAADLLRQTADEARAKSEGCQSAKCHVGIEPMHASPAVRLGCTDCHGGNPTTTDKLAGQNVDHKVGEVVDAVSTTVTQSFRG